LDEDVVRRFIALGQVDHLIYLVSVAPCDDQVEVNRKPCLVCGGQTLGERRERSASLGETVVTFGGRTVHAEG
jgi:hypothetical protein